MSKHKRSAQGLANRQARRNMFAALIENCYGTEAGRHVTTVWAESKTGLVPVGVVELDLLKPEKVHGGTVEYHVTVLHGQFHVTGGIRDNDDNDITSRTVNKRASRLSQDFRRR